MIKCYLRRLMADHKIDDITQLMGMTGLSRNSINKLYREEDVSSVKIETLMKICDTFDCKLSDLIEYIPDSKKIQNDK